MINHQISDLIARINNARNLESKKINVVKTNENIAIISKLEKEGYITVVEITKNAIRLIPNSIQKIKVISTPGRRIYRSWKDLKQGYSYITLIRTSQGIITSSEAIVKKLGGEILLKIR